MPLNVTEPETNVHGWGIEYEDGRKVICMQTLRENKTVINQILVPVEVLNNPKRIQFAWPIDYEDDIAAHRKMAKLLFVTKAEQDRYVATKLTRIIGAIILDGKEFPMTVAGLKTAEMLLGMFANGVADYRTQKANTANREG